MSFSFVLSTFPGFNAIVFVFDQFGTELCNSLKHSNLCILVQMFVTARTVVRQDVLHPTVVPVFGIKKDTEQQKKTCVSHYKKYTINQEAHTHTHTHTHTTTTTLLPYSKFSSAPSGNVSKKEVRVINAQRTGVNATHFADVN